MADKEKQEQATQAASAKAEKAKKTEKKAKPSMFARAKRWFREMKSELKKVVWPTRSQTINNTLIVIACVIVVGVCIWIFDAVAVNLVNALIGLFR